MWSAPRYLALVLMITLPILAGAAVGLVLSGRRSWWQALLLFWAALGGIELLYLGALFMLVRRPARPDGRCPSEPAPEPQARD